MSRNQTALYKQKSSWRSPLRQKPLSWVSLSGGANVVQNLPGPEYGKKKRDSGGDMMNLWNDEDEKRWEMIWILIMTAALTTCLETMT